MANVERNFRSHYYEKVGFKGVEEKKSLDIILAEVPIDLGKLQNVCLRLPVPGIYRSSVWRILLGILPPYTTSQDAVWSLRVDQVTELERVLRVTRKLGQNTTTNLTLIWLLNNNRLKFNVIDQLAETDCKNFEKIATALLQILENNTEVLWVSMGLHELLARQSADWKSLKETILKLLKDDSELVEHLECNSILDDLYANSQIFQTGFSTVLQPNLLERLWDKVLSGGFKVLLYTLSSFLVSDRFRKEIFEVTSGVELMRMMSAMSEVEQETVLTHAIDVWEMDGCPLPPSGKQVAALAAETAVSPPQLPPGETNIDNRLSREINIM